MKQKLTITVDAELLQVAAARACGARCIVTRNVRDYARSPIPAVDPEVPNSELF